MATGTPAGRDCPAAGCYPIFQVGTETLSPYGQRQLSGCALPHKFGPHDPQGGGRRHPPTGSEQRHRGPTVRGKVLHHVATDGPAPQMQTVFQLEVEALCRGCLSAVLPGPCGRGQLSMPRPRHAGGHYGMAWDSQPHGAYHPVAFDIWKYGSWTGHPAIRRARHSRLPSADDTPTPLREQRHAQQSRKNGWCQNDQGGLQPRYTRPRSSPNCLWPAPNISRIVYCDFSAPTSPHSTQRESF